MQILALITFRFAWHRFAAQVQFTCTFYNVQSAQKSAILCRMYRKYYFATYNVLQSAIYNVQWYPGEIILCVRHFYCAVHGAFPRVTASVEKSQNKQTLIWYLRSLRLYTPVVNLGGTTLTQWFFLCFSSTHLTDLGLSRK